MKSPKADWKINSPSGSCLIIKVQAKNVLLDICAEKKSGTLHTNIYIKMDHNVTHVGDKI